MSKLHPLSETHGTDADREGKLVASGERTIEGLLEDGFDGVSSGIHGTSSVGFVNPAKGLIVFRRGTDMVDRNETRGM